MLFALRKQQLLGQNFAAEQTKKHQKRKSPLYTIQKRNQKNNLLWKKNESASFYIFSDAERALIIVQVVQDFLELRLSHHRKKWVRFLTQISKMSVVTVVKNMNEMWMRNLTNVFAL